MTVFPGTHRDICVFGLIVILIVAIIAIPAQLYIRAKGHGVYFSSAKKAVA